MDAGPRLAIIHARRMTAVARRLAAPIKLKQIVCIDGQDVRQLDGTCADREVHELLDVDLARWAVLGAESERLDLIYD